MSAAAPGRAASPLGYRAPLDGLRAVAVLMVMLSHSHPTLKNGELGVDIFFALSGFLITTLIMQEMGSSSGSFGYARFYVRRSLRLFPALYAMLAVFGLYALLRWRHLDTLMAPAGGSRSDLVVFFAGAATYTTNLFGLAGRAGNLFGHTWSLAVEEQFYLVWPVLLVSLTRRNLSRALMFGLLVFWAMCLAARVGGLPGLEGFLWLRPDAIALGCAAALARWHGVGPRAVIERHGALLAPACLAGIGIIALCESRVPIGISMADGLSSVVAVLAAVLVWSLVDGRATWFSDRLAARPAVAIGLLSYSLYLWHQPIFRVMAWEFRGYDQTLVLVAKWLLSFGAAWLSYRLVEIPTRRLQQRFRSGGSTTLTQRLFGPIS